MVPGVLLLGHVLAAFARAHGAARVYGLTQVKFLSPLLPDEACAIEFSRVSERRAEFACTVAQRIVARGALLIER